MMKQIWKTAVLTLLGTVFALCLGMGVSAETHSGSVSRPETHTYPGCEFTWEVDTEAGTLTITVPDLGRVRASFVVDETPWQPWEKDIQKIILWGNGSFESPGLREDLPEDQRSAFLKSIQRMPLKEMVSSWGDGFSWVYTPENKTLTYYGNGTVDKSSFEMLVGWDPEQLAPETIILSDGYVWGDFCSKAPKLVVSKTVGPEGQPIWSLDAGYVEVSKENPLYCSYDGAVYSKDGSTLFYSGNREMKFHQNLRSIAPFSLNLDGGTLVIPWGVEFIDHDAFACLSDIDLVLPDTITFINEINYWLREKKQEPYEVVILFSKENKEAAGKLREGTSNRNLGKLIPRMEESVAKYYPDVPEAQGPGPASAPTESKPEASSQPESSAPESSVPASKPESSTPASQPAESSVPESSASSEETSSSPLSESSSAQSSENASEAEASEVSVEESSTEESSQEESAAKTSSESSESAESSEPEGLPTVEKEVGRSVLWVVLAIAIVAAGVVALLVKRNKKK